MTFCQGHRGRLIAPTADNECERSRSAIVAMASLVPSCHSERSEESPAMAHDGPPTQILRFAQNDMVRADRSCLGNIIIGPPGVSLWPGSFVKLHDRPCASYQIHWFTCIIGLKSDSCVKIRKVPLYSLYPVLSHSSYLAELPHHCPNSMGIHIPNIPNDSVNSGVFP